MSVSHMCLTTSSIDHSDGSRGLCILVSTVVELASASLERRAFAFVLRRLSRDSVDQRRRGFDFVDLLSNDCWPSESTIKYKHVHYNKLREYTFFHESSLIFVQVQKPLFLFCFFKQIFRIYSPTRQFHAVHCKLL